MRGPHRPCKDWNCHPTSTKCDLAKYFHVIFRVIQPIEKLQALSVVCDYNWPQTLQVVTVCWITRTCLGNFFNWGIYVYWAISLEQCTPLIRMSARRAMAEQVVCRALGEQPLSSHRATVVGGCLPNARQSICSAIDRQALVGISGVGSAVSPIMTPSYLALALGITPHNMLSNFSTWWKFQFSEQSAFVVDQLIVAKKSAAQIIPYTTYSKCRGPLHPVSCYQKRLLYYRSFSQC